MNTCTLLLFLNGEYNKALIWASPSCVQDLPTLEMTWLCEPDDSELPPRHRAGTRPEVLQDLAVLAIEFRAFFFFLLLILV